MDYKLDMLSTKGTRQQKAIIFSSTECEHFSLSLRLDENDWKLSCIAWQLLTVFVPCSTTEKINALLVDLWA